MNAPPHEPPHEPPHRPPYEPATLAALRPMLVLFAQALAGRAVVLREDGTDRRAAARAAPSPGRPPLDIALPAQIASFRSTRDNRAAYRIGVMRQALCAHDDELLASAQAVASPPWRRVFAALERLRVDAAIERLYAGARTDLARQRGLELAQRVRSPPRRWPALRALDALWRHALGETTTLPPADHDRTAVQAMLRHADTLCRVDAAPVDSARAATSICGLLGVRAQRKRHFDEPPAGGDATAALLGPTRPEPSGTDATDTTATPQPGATGFDAAHRGAADGTGAITTLTSIAGSARPVRPRAAPRSSRGQPSAGPRGAQTVRTGVDDDSERAGHVHAIDEWDYRQQRLLPAWCTLVERRLRGNDTGFIHHVRRQHPELARRVHRRFASWRPDGLQRVHGASDGDELEIDAVIEAMVDLRAGFVDDRSWYVRRDRAQRDVATAFLVDTSASTDFVLPDGVMGPPRPAPSAAADAVYLYDLAVSAPPPDPPKRRVIDVAKEALALMCDALHTLGDCFAVYTFSGHGRTRVEFRVVKPFHEAVSSRTAAALAALRPHGATRTGAAIRHATAQLLRQPQRRRTLIVVTDGYPEDIDYGPEPRDLRYGIEDTAHALHEARLAGVDTFCLSIDPAGHDYLRRMCARDRYMAIGELAALPGELAKVYQAMTRPVV